MSNYELTYILRPLEEANLTATNERINTIVKNAGGEIVARNDWGRRRLAYPIQKINDGYYSTLYLNLPGGSVRNVERSLRLNDDVMRFLVVRVETLTPPSAPAQQTVPAEAAPVVEAAAPAQTEASAVTPEASEATPAADTTSATTAEG